MYPAPSPNSFKSWPTQKPRPAPVTTTARTSGSRASLNAATSCRCSSAVKALRTSGRLSVIVRAPPSRVVSTSAIGGSLGDLGRAVAGRDREDVRLPGALAREGIAHGGSDRLACGTGHQHKNRAANPAADHPRAERTATPCRVDCHLELRRRDLEIVTERGVRGREERGELGEPAGSEQLGSLEHPRVLRDNVAHESRGAVAEQRRGPLDVGARGIAKGRKAKGVRGLLAG